MRSVHVYRRLLGGSGGGQLYTFAIAEALADAGYDVSCGSVDGPDRAAASHGSGLGLANVRFVKYPSEAEVEFDGDLLIHVANADLALRARPGARQVAVVFLPESIHRIRDVARVARNRLIGRPGYDAIGTRMSRYHEFWAISEFGRAALKRRWGVNSQLLPPPLLQLPGVSRLPVMSRRPEVLLLGRISPEKQLLEVIDAFASSALPETHSLRLIGERPPSDPYAARVLEAALKAGAEVNLSVPRDSVLDALAQARFLWHGMGVGVDPVRRPELVEHFGMVVLEAMAWGCIPLVADRGGPAELVPPSLQVNGFSEFVGVTLGIEGLPDTEADELQSNLVTRASTYSWPQFAASATSLVREQIGPPSGA